MSKNNSGNGYGFGSGHGHGYGHGYSSGNGHGYSNGNGYGEADQYEKLTDLELIELSLNNA